MKTAFAILFLVLGGFISAQEINQLDANGKYHGVWKKNFEGTNILRYEGAFSHGKEIGMFKFYKNYNKKAILTATKAFNETDAKAYVKFFASSGKVVSEGQMDGKKHIGAWKYYQKTNSKLLTLEHYNDSGHLHGERTVYYPNGQIAEKQTYINGKLDGVSTVYSEKNILLSELIYVNGELHGYSKYYSPKAEMLAEGWYKNGKKEGVWKYYEDGKLTEEKDLSYVPKKTKKQ
ncbi:toxin-antitoxin system YwqK family antitoxin [Mariniflexile sp. AS56]|uniref:toxin-antitoxin system YwqK family antitoxin n=1 Tax=Mariniflexile sp. AS56 TaxID=3063957 RepID=UPI0026ED938D|nr:toxin-antitoxin system YwqK family antitoxin [Mariniflexile sp. AS56]MDO7172784.1 toxin-antitoxin system YwqK family antitoxin [Mariniflexile sp. AS56]